MKFTEEQMTDLNNYLTSNDCKYQNLHTRHTITKNKKKQIYCLNAVKLIDGKIYGILSGPTVNLRYVINNRGNLKVSNSNLTDDQIEDLIPEIVKGINTCVKNGFPKHNIKRTPGMFYLQRCLNGIYNKRAEEIVRQQIVTEEFVRQILQWNFRIIRSDVKRQTNV